MSEKLSLVVLISGSGSNLQSIIDGAASDLPVEIKAVISNKAEAYGLERARSAGIETRVLNHNEFDGRDSYDQAWRSYRRVSARLGYSCRIYAYSYPNPS